MDNQPAFINDVNHVPCGIHSLDKDGFFMFINKTELEWLGYAEEEIVGKKKFSELTTNRGRQRFAEMFPEFKRESKIRDLEFELVRKDGSLISVVINSNAIFDEKGNYIGSQSFVTDISRLKISESLLRAQDALTTTITDNATVALFMMNAQGYCTFMNPAAEKMTGFTFAEISEKPLHEMIHHHRPDGSLYPMEECPIDRALPENFDVRAHEDVFIKKDGTFFPVTCAASPIFENGRPVATVIEVRDLSDQKKYHDEITRKSESLEILNTIGRIISGQLDLQSILQDVTDATTKLSGAEFGAFFYNSRNEQGEAMMLYTLSGAPRSAFDKFGMPRNTAVFHSTFSGEGIVRVDDITKDPRYGKNDPYFGMPEGHLPVVSYLALPVRSKTGEVIGGLFFGHSKPAVFTQEAEDLVSGVAAQASVAIDNARLFEDLVKANKENERLLAQAQESDRKKDEFMGIASHELKTPLTSMKAYSQLMVNASKAGEFENLPKYAVKVEEGVGRLERLVNDLLDVSRIHSGKLQMDFTEFDFVTLLKSTVENIFLVSPQFKIITDHPSSVVVKADKERLEQVLVNLLTNAIKYSPGKNRIDVTVKSENDKLIVTVKDYGIGIPKDKIAKIFTRFYRVDDKSMRFSGLGIGLYISAEIISRHGGSIYVDSEVGQGSSFTFSIPFPVTSH